MKVRIGAALAVLVGVVVFVLWATRPPDVYGPESDATPPARSAADEPPGPMPAPDSDGDPAPGRDGFENDVIDGPGPEGPWSRKSEVRILDDATGVPVAGAEVHVALRFPTPEDDPPFVALETDADGRATLPSSTLFTVWYVRKSGYLVARREYEKVPDSVEFRLVAARPLPGRVVRAGDRRPVAGARVHLWKEGWSLATIDRMIVTDADGRFVLPGRPGDYPVMVGVAADGFASAIVRCAPDDPADPLEIVLGEGGTVTGRVLGDAGRPVAAAEVYVAERGGDDPLREAEWDRARDLHEDLVEALRNRTRSAPDGTFRVVGLAAPADYVVHARGPDGAEGHGEPFSIRASGEEVRSDVRLSTLAEILIRVVDAKTGAVIDPGDCRSTIDAEWTEAADHEKAGYHPEDDLEVLREVRPGQHVVYVESRDHVDERVRVEVRPGERKLLVVRVDPGVSISGRLVDEDGAPLEAHVAFTCRAGEIEHYEVTTTGEDGRFEIRGVPEVAGLLEAFPEGRAATEWKDVMPGRDLGELVVGIGPRIVFRLTGVETLEGAQGGLYYEEDGGGTTGDVEPESDGRFVFADALPGRRLHVFLRLPGHAAFVKRGIVLKANETLDLGEVRLPEPVTVKGTVVDSSGKPVPRALVFVSEYWHEEPVTADGSGKFEVPLMPPGLSHLVVEVKGTMRAYVPVDVAPDAEPVVLRILAQGTILATVRDRRGDPVPDFPFNAMPIGADGRPDRNRRAIVGTDSRGILRLDAVPGAWTLEPHPNRKRALAAPCPPIEVTDGNTTRVELTLD